MLKQSFYTSHDFNARNDEKILELRAKYGWEGYGLYWALIEMMGEAKGNKLSLGRINGVAMALPYDPSKLRDFISHLSEAPINLFISRSGFFWSNSLLVRMEMRKTKKKKLSEAGKRGALKRWENNNIDSHPIATLKPPQCDCIARKGKERKEKENKGNKRTNTPSATLPVCDLANGKPEKTKPKAKTHLTEKQQKHFNILWEQYPKKIGKEDSIRHYNATVKTNKDKIEIQTALDNYIGHLMAEKRTRQYTQDASRWFNTWKDWVELETPIPAKSLADQNIL